MARDPQAWIAFITLPDWRSCSGSIHRFHFILAGNSPPSSAQGALRRLGCDVLRIALLFSLSWVIRHCAALRRLRA
jgi:hypothetical protein